MKIIRTVSSENGAYPPPVECDSATIPEGYAIIRDGLDMTAFYANGGFITPTFTDGVLVSYVANTDAWNAWKAAHPEPPAPTETTEQKLEALTRSFNLTTSAMYAYMEGNS
jgi:hypothetical protein